MSREQDIDKTFWTSENTSLLKIRKATEYDPDVSFRSKEIMSHIINLDKNNLGTLEILDVGGGLGGIALKIFERHIPSRITLLDSDHNAIKESRESLHSFPCHFVESDALQLPFISKTFDTVICSEVLEHLPDDEKALKEISRVLKDSGIVIITIPFQEKKLAKGHLRAYDLGSFQRLCTVAHLNIKKISFRCRSIVAIIKFFRFLRRNRKVVQSIQDCHRKMPMIPKFITLILSPIDNMLARREQLPVLFKIFDEGRLVACLTKRTEQSQNVMENKTSLVFSKNRGTESN